MWPFRVPARLQPALMVSSARGCAQVLLVRVVLCDFFIFELIDLICDFFIYLYRYEFLQHQYVQVAFKTPSWM
jgi:hypothetical protein